MNIYHRNYAYTYIHIQQTTETPKHWLINFVNLCVVSVVMSDVEIRYASFGCLVYDSMTDIRKCCGSRNSACVMCSNMHSTI